MLYAQYCCTCYREKQNSLEAARINRMERTIARRACQSKALCGCLVYLAGSHRVSTCRRPVGPLLGWGVGMMTLCCAVACCVEYGCSDPSINSSCRGSCQPEKIQNISANDSTLSILPILGVSITHAKRFQRGYR